MAQRIFTLAVLLTVPLGLSAPVAYAPGSSQDGGTKLRFEVSVASGLLEQPRDGRLLLVIGNRATGEPRFGMGRVDKGTSPLLGVDAHAITSDSKVIVDEKAAIFPLAHLSQLKPGKYRVQAVLHTNRDLNIPNAPGNLYSDPVAMELDPARGGSYSLTLSHQIFNDELPAETQYVKYVKIKSDLLSKFHGRPMYLRAGVILPKDFATDTERRYPLWLRIGGYGTRFTGVGRMMADDARFRKLWLDNRAPQMILLFTDGAGPYGDPYQVNSANVGPLGDAITKELIPLVEKRFRGIGQPYARVVEGHSTGGWVSLALQVFYPDFFNGCWSHAPDPVDFRAYELIDIYKDDNAYADSNGRERAAMRNLAGNTLTTVRHETQLEKVLGRGNRWELSGKDWCAWNAVFGPRGEDGLPRPLWDGQTGKIDKSVIEHWKKYDLRRVLQGNWPALAPKLKGKIRIWVGEMDDYFLNNAVHLLDDFLSKADPPYEGKITYGPRQGHGWRGLSDKQMMEDMARTIEKGRSAAQSSTGAFQNRK